MRPSALCLIITCSPNKAQVHHTSAPGPSFLQLFPLLIHALCPAHMPTSPGLVTVVVTVVVVMMVVVVSSSPASGPRGGPGEAGPGRGGAVVPGGGVSSSGAVGPAPLSPLGVTAVVRGPVPGSVARGREGAARVWPAGGVASVGSGSDPGTVQGKSGHRRSKFAGLGWGVGLKETGGSPLNPKNQSHKRQALPPFSQTLHLLTGFSQPFFKGCPFHFPFHLSKGPINSDCFFEPSCSPFRPGPSPVTLLLCSLLFSGMLY